MTFISVQELMGRLARLNLWRRSAHYDINVVRDSIIQNSVAFPSVAWHTCAKKCCSRNVEGFGSGRHPQIMHQTKTEQEKNTEI